MIELIDGFHIRPTANSGIEALMFGIRFPGPVGCTTKAVFEMQNQRQSIRGMEDKLQREVKQNIA